MEDNENKRFLSWSAPLPLKDNGEIDGSVFTGLQQTNTWQSEGVTSSVYSNSILATDNQDIKPDDYDRETLQKMCWHKYRTFPGIHSSVEDKGDLITSKGFDVYSVNRKINEVLRDTIFSQRNLLFERIGEWPRRMLAEGELFLLNIVDENGNNTVRIIEPDRITGAEEGSGLITDPDDVTKTLFYRYQMGNSSYALVPSEEVIYNPKLEEKVKNSKYYNVTEVAHSKNPSPAYVKLGGYYKYIIHWKNLSGISKIRRDSSYLRTVIEWANLYENSIKWGLDYKKAQSSYAIVISFADTQPGRLAYNIWTTMTEAEKEATGLTKPLTPGSKIFLRPGMSIDIKSPQLSKGTGENLDLLNLVGAGVKSPQDLMQGNSSGATLASLKMSRNPFQMNIENLQDKFSKFLVYRYFRAIFYCKSAVDKFPFTFPKKFVEEVVDGKPTVETIQVEPAELIEVSMPKMTLIEDEGTVRTMLGSKHMGINSLGISQKFIAETLGVSDFTRQKRERLLEDEVYGEMMPMEDQEGIQEKRLNKTGAEGESVKNKGNGKANNGAEVNA